MRDYLLDCLLITTTSRTTTSTPIKVHSHIPPPIHSFVPCIAVPLSLGRDQAHHWATQPVWDSRNVI